MQKYYSQVIFKLQEANLLRCPDSKDLLKFIIRKFSETSSYHCSAQFRSSKVKEKTKDISSESLYHSYCSKNFKHEHIVPCQALYEILKDKKFSSPREILDWLSPLSIRATITIEEDNILNSAGYKSKMPPEFFDENHELYNDPFARYKKTGIFSNLKKGSMQICVLPRFKEHI